MIMYIMFSASHLFVLFLVQYHYLITIGSKIRIAACQGDTLIFNCTVNGGHSTVWKGSAFNCMSTNNEIVLLHSRSNGSSVNGSCNDSDIAAYAILYSNGDEYFSEINVTTTSPFTVSSFTVICFHDSGTNTIVVSNWTVSVSNDLDSPICRGSTNDTSPYNPKQDEAGILLINLHAI